MIDRIPGEDHTVLCIHYFDDIYQAMYAMVSLIAAVVAQVKVGVFSEPDQFFALCIYRDIMEIEISHRLVASHSIDALHFLIEEHI